MEVDATRDTEREAFDELLKVKKAEVCGAPVSHSIVPNSGMGMPWESTDDGCLVL